MACPHCGGKNGILTNVVFKAVRVTTWDGKDADTDNYQLLSETDARCLDCLQPVRRAFKDLKAGRLGTESTD